MHDRIRRFLRDEDGATALEYAMLLGVVGLALVTLMQDITFAGLERAQDLFDKILADST